MTLKQNYITFSLLADAFIQMRTIEAIKTKKSAVTSLSFY